MNIIISSWLSARAGCRLLSPVSFRYNVIRLFFFLGERETTCIPAGNRILKAYY